MNKHELHSLNLILPQPETPEYIKLPVFKAEALPCDAEEIDNLLFINYGNRIKYKKFVDWLIFHSFKQDDNPNMPNLVPMNELTVITKPEKVKKYEYRHTDMQIIHVKDQNGPSEGCIESRAILDDKDFYNIRNRNLI